MFKPLVSIISIHIAGYWSVVWILRFASLNFFTIRYAATRAIIVITMQTTHEYMSDMYPIYLIADTAVLGIIITPRQRAVVTIIKYRLLSEIQSRRNSAPICYKNTYLVYMLMYATVSRKNCDNFQILLSFANTRCLQVTMCTYTLSCVR